MKNTPPNTWLSTLAAIHEALTALVEVELPTIHWALSRREKLGSKRTRRKSMDNPQDLSKALVPPGENLPALAGQLPAIVSRAGKAAVFAADEFFFGRIRNEHTRAAYLHAVKQFLSWADGRGLELVTISPEDVGRY